jgi:ribosome-binding factor A
MAGDHSKRVQRVQRELFETISHFLQHSLPLPLPCHATVSAVDLSQDLSSARVFFRLVGADPDVKEGEAILRGECGRFQRHVARELALKFTPTLRFEFGHAPHLDEIDELFASLRKPKFGDE